MDEYFEDSDFIKEMGPTIIATVQKNIKAKKQVNVENFKRFGIARKAFLKLIEQENVVVDGESTAVLIDEGIDEGFNTAFVEAKFVDITVNKKKRELFRTILENADVFGFEGGIEEGWFIFEMSVNNVFDILE